MKALVMVAPGGPEQLQLREVPEPVRILDEVLVRVVAAGVNPIDAKTRSGRGVFTAVTALPCILGFDFAGVVEAVPYIGHPLKPGDRVYGMTRVPRTSGSYAELVTVPSNALAPMPSALGFSEAAAVPLAALTAWGLVVEMAQAEPGKRILIHAGAGGVGHFAVQLAARRGARVTTTGSSAHRAFLTDLGAERVIDYREERFEEVVGEMDVVIDLLGNAVDDTGFRSLQVVRGGGLLVNLPTGSWPTLAEDAARANVRATGYVVQPDANVLRSIGRMIDAAELRVHVQREFPLAQGAESHRLLEQGHTRGKIVLRVTES